MGLFPLSQLQTKAPVTLIPRCGICKLYKAEDCNSPKMKVGGKGRKGILICGEAPGRTEDEQGRQFVGDAGDKLWGVLNRLGIERRDCWTTNALICWPHKNGKNRTPTDKEVGYCRPNLVRTIQELQPEIILPLGAVAVKSLIGWLWKEDPGAIGRWLGWRIPCQKVNAWICPNWHPSYLVRNEGVNNEVMEKLFEYYFVQALKLVGKGRPWDIVPDYLSQVKCIFNPDEAAKVIRTFKGTVAFDYETNTLKPDAEHCQIVSCAISDGKTTIAYPWHGEAIKATKALLMDESIGKIAANMKFELRHSIKHLGAMPKNMAFDTMLATHTLDNRPEICSLKFQAFVQLGVSSYDDHISPFLRSKEPGANSVNRIHEIKLADLLKYNGADALLEYLLAKKQTRKFGIEI